MKWDKMIFCNNCCLVRKNSGGIGSKGDGKENSKEIPEIEEFFSKENSADHEMSKLELNFF